MYKLDFKGDFTINQVNLNLVIDSIVHSAATGYISELRESVTADHVKDYTVTFAEILCYIIEEENKGHSTKAYANIEIDGSVVNIALKLRSRHPDTCCDDFAKQSIVAANGIMSFLDLECKDSHL